MINFAPGNNPYQQYKKSSVETATPEKLLLMLFDGAIKFANQGIEAINNNNIEKANNSLLKVQDIFNELMITLDLDKGGELARNLLELYSFYQGEVIKANISKDTARLQPVIEFLHLYRSTWAEVSRLAQTQSNLVTK